MSFEMPKLGRSHDAPVPTSGKVEGVSNNSSEKEKSFEIWKTIQTGNFKDKDSLLKALGEKTAIPSVMKMTLQQPYFQVETEQKERNLVRVTLGDLGFTNEDFHSLARSESHDPTYEEIYSRAIKAGLKETVTEVVAQLILQENEEEKKQREKIPEKDRSGDVIIGSKVFKSASRSKTLFSLRSDDNNKTFGKISADSASDDINYNRLEQNFIFEK